MSGTDGKFHLDCWSPVKIKSEKFVCQLFESDFHFLYSICTLKVKMSYKQVKTMSETLPHWSFQLDVFSNIKFKMSESWLSD